MSRPITIFLLIFFFIALRLALFNLNAAEWGDSYHILRSSQEITQLKYSLEEKRLPGFSVLIAPFLFVFEPVTAGRIVVALATLAVLILSYKLSQKLFPKSNWHLWVPVLLCISPVFLYWSFRVMAILPFTALVLLAFYVFNRVQPSIGFNPQEGWTLLGIVLAFACLTRYEGFLLLPGFFLFYVLKRRWRELLAVFIPWALVTLPWFVWSKLIAKGPAGAAYFSEAATFNLFDWERFRFFGMSVLFLFIFPPFWVFVYKGLRRLRRPQAPHSFSEGGEMGGELVDWLPLGSFLVLESILAFFWTPSVPRILIPVMPFLLMFFLEGASGVLEPEFPRARLLGLSSGEGKSLAPESQSRALFLRAPWLLLSLILFLVYILGQYYERAYFLVLSHGGMGLVLGFSVLAMASLFVGKRGSIALSGKGAGKEKSQSLDAVESLTLGNCRGFKTALLLFAGALAVSSFVIVGNQRKIYTTVREVSEQAAQLDGKTAYSDETGVSWWYLTRLSDKGVYLPQKTELSSEEQWQWLAENNVRHILWTNEFNRGSVLDVIDSSKFKSKFEIIEEVEVEVADVIDSLLIRLGFLLEREYPRLRSVLYSISYE